MDTTTERKRVNIRQAMQIAGVSRRTIHNWLRLGKVEYVRTAGGGARIYADSLFRLDKTKPPAQT
jgi:predicted site-specific integrase-resolvase